MSNILVVFATASTNRRVLINFDQVTRVEAGGVTSTIHYCDGNRTVVLASFDELCSVVERTIGEPISYAAKTVRPQYDS